MDQWTNICRSCLVKSDTFSYFIYENINPETYSFCTSIEVNRDELPKSLCSCCYDLLKQFTEFKKTCIQSENKLLSYFNYLKLEDKTLLDVKTEVNDYKTGVDVKTEANVNETGVDVKTEVNEIETRVYVEIEVNEININNEEVAAVVANSDNKLDDDTPGSDFIDNSNSQEPGKTVLKGDDSTKNQKDLKAPRPKKPAIYTCDLCNKQFVFKRSFETHKLKYHGKEVSIQCKACNITFETWNYLTYHNRSVHTHYSLEDLTCKVCSKEFKTPYSLRMHQKTHAERKVLCDECGKKFKDEVGLKSHLRIHVKNRQRSIPCQHCGNKYLTKTNLARHLSRSHNDRRFICDYCSYPFADKAILIKHIMIHEGTRRLYKCDVCFRVLTAPASLKAHKRIHTGEKPFSCNLCPRRFAIKRGLDNHQRIHTGEKPFKCAVCEQSFSQSNSRRRHMKIHDKRCM